MSSNPSKLKPRQRRNARRLAANAALLALRNAPAVHYTQGARRWEGIDQGDKAWRGRFPNYADCSSFYTWCIWNGLSHYGVRDVVNGQKWRAGYTGTMLQHGVEVDHLIVGDAVIYGPRGSTGRHVALYIGGGFVISHGSEGGPYKVPVNYRADIQSKRRYI